MPGYAIGGLAPTHTSESSRRLSGTDIISQFPILVFGLFEGRHVQISGDGFHLREDVQLRIHVGLPHYGTCHPQEVTGVPAAGPGVWAGPPPWDVQQWLGVSAWPLLRCAGLGL